MKKIEISKMTSESMRDILIFEKLNEIVDKLNDLEEIVYQFTGHIKP